MDNLSPLIAKVFLTFSHATLIAPLILVGFLTQKKAFLKTAQPGFPVWMNACVLIFFTMIFNTFLKSIFLIPLDPALGKEGFAFPSGHMQVSVVFYGWLFLVYPSRLIRSFILVVLMGISFGLIQQGYHTFNDVLAAIVFGILTIYGFDKVSQHPAFQNNGGRLGSYLILLSGVMMGVIQYRTGIPIHVYGGFVGLLIVTLTRLFWRPERR